MDVIESSYRNPESVAAYSGHEKLFREAHRRDPQVSRNDVTNFLEGNTTYTLHRRRKLKFKRKRTIPAGFFSHMQVDLMDMQKLARENDNYTFVLVAVEVLSRQLYAIPVKNKSAQEMIKAFDRLFAMTPALPLYVYSDRGGEFESREMRRYFSERDIQKHAAFVNTIKASLAERYIRTLKEKLYRYFSDHATLRWIEVLPKFVHSINASVAKSTGMRPCDVNFDNAPALWKKIYSVDLRPHRSTRCYIKKGDAVRLAREKYRFEKGYLPTFSDEIMRVRRVITGNPITYELEDQDGEPFLGQFYREELCKTRIDADTTYRIEQVLRERIRKGEKQLFVQFKGVKRPRWINESDIV